MEAKVEAILLSIKNICCLFYIICCNYYTICCSFYIKFNHLSHFQRLGKCAVNNVRKNLFSVR